MTKSSEKNTVLRLGKVHVINDMSHLKELLTTYYEKKINISINSESVEMIDTASLQLLLSFKKTLELEGVDVIWSVVSDEIRRRAEILGLQEELGLL